MKTIKNDFINEFIIKNSRFITLLFKIDNSNIDDILEDVKKKYPKATHYCFAYRFGDIKKSSDDGEPTGTAGAPILGVIEKEDLNNILVIVVRYFGGIKLGAGGLIRAYTKSVTEALKQVEFINLEEGLKVRITFDYSEEKQVDYILRNSEIINKEYGEVIIYTALIKKELTKTLVNYNFEIIENVYISSTL